jgi:hypothetical protein
MVFYILRKLKCHTLRLAQLAPLTIHAAQVAPQTIVNGNRAAPAKTKKVKLNKLLSRCFTKKKFYTSSSAHNVLYLTR